MKTLLYILASISFVVGCANLSSMQEWGRETVFSFTERQILLYRGITFILLGILFVLGGLQL
jgi:hypothetical protein